MSKSDIDPFKPGSPLEQALHSLSGAIGGQSWSPGGGFAASRRNRRLVELVQLSPHRFQVPGPGSPFM